MLLKSRNFLLLLVVSGVCKIASAFVPPALKTLPTTSIQGSIVGVQATRRDAIAFFVAGTLSAAQFPSLSNAFDNRISTKYDDRPKQRGPKPKDLGVTDRRSTSLEGDASEYVGLKGCGAAPNCFSSSLPASDDPEHSIPAFVWPDGQNQEQAFDNLKAAIMAYPPGQNGVDGGGFEIQSFDAQKGYLYVQFQSLKNGYIDDVEFAVAPGTGEREVQVRSSSRLGYLDFGVNAKRVNCIAKSLQSKGWKAPGVDLNTHMFYKLENQL